jgi:hypothetical protein
MHAFHENTQKIHTFHNCLLQNLSPVSTPRDKQGFFILAAYLMLGVLLWMMRIFRVTRD